MSKLSNTLAALPTCEFCGRKVCDFGCDPDTHVKAYISEATATEHIERANRAARNSPDAFGRAMFLAQASARVRSERFWSILPDLFREFEAGTWADYLNGAPSDTTTGGKFGGIFSLRAKLRGTAANYANRAALHSEVYGAANDIDALDALRKSADWLSAVKGAFVVQLTRGGLGCLDAVNTKRLGLEGDPSRYSSAKYAAMCEAHGGSVRLWTEWINHVADERGCDAEALSLAHATFIEDGTAPALTFATK